MISWATGNLRTGFTPSGGAIVGSSAVSRVPSAMGAVAARPDGVRSTERFRPAGIISGGKAG